MLSRYANRQVIAALDRTLQLSGVPVGPGSAFIQTRMANGLAIGVREIGRRIGRVPCRRSPEGCAGTQRSVATSWPIGRRRRSGTPAARLPPEGRQARRQRPAAGLRAKPSRRHDRQTRRRPVPGPDVRFIGRRQGGRADRRWAKSWSPEQTSNRLRVDFVDDESKGISPEAIYQGPVPPGPRCAESGNWSPACERSRALILTVTYERSCGCSPRTIQRWGYRRAHAVMVREGHRVNARGSSGCGEKKV